jgi:hypothetical protein
METTHKELRKLKMPHGVHKSSTNCSSPSRNAAFQACQACYARKKRCVTSPSHHQCTYCFREGQRCLPRERPVKYGNLLSNLQLHQLDKLLIFKLFRQPTEPCKNTLLRVHLNKPAPNIICPCHRVSTMKYPDGARCTRCSRKRCD